MPGIDIDEFEDYEDRGVRLGGGGGGGGRKKEGPTEAEKQAVAMVIENSKRNTQAEADKVVEKWDIDTALANVLEMDIDNTDMFHFRQYLDWLVLAMAQGLKLNDKEIEFKASQSGGPGGQNVNKRSTAAEYHHPKSGIFGAWRDNKSQDYNKKKAYFQLRQRLTDHIQEWRDTLKTYRHEEGKQGASFGEAMRGVLKEKIGDKIQNKQKDGYDRVVNRYK